MTAKRLRRIIRSRWWVLAIAVLLSMVAAVLVTQSRNNAIPEYEAVGTVTFQRLVGEVDDIGAQERLSTARQIATSVNASDLSTGRDPLSAGEPAEVVARGNDLTLVFIGRAATAEEASAIANRLLGRYLAAQQLDMSEDLAARIADTASRLDAIVIAMAAATDPPGLTDIETAARIRELQSEVSTLASLYGDLTAELLNPRDPPRPREEVIADRTTVSEDLREAQDELLGLQFEVGIATSETVELSLLRAEQEQLQSALDDLMAASLVEEPIGLVSAVEAHPAGIEPTPLWWAIVIGLLIGLLIGIAGLVIVDRVRQPLWEITELEPRYWLPEMVARPRTYGEQTEPWYGTASQGPRKAGIQELRSHVEGLPGFGSGVVVGVAAFGSSSSVVHELAADLASGLGYSGSWALLIDADYLNPSDLPEYRRDNLDLEEVVADPRQTVFEAARYVEEEEAFLGVAIRNRGADAADLLAKPAFATMLDTVQEVADVVIVGCPPTNSASYHVLSQRLDAMILVATAGDLPPAVVSNALHTLEERRSRPVGVVLVFPRVGPLSLIQEGFRESTPGAAPYPPPDPGWQWASGEAAPQGDPAAEPAGDATSDASTWQYRDVAPWADDTVPPPSGEAVEAGTPADDAAAATRATERITRRALTRKRVVDAPPEDKEPERPTSPWSFRHRNG